MKWIPFFMILFASACNMSESFIRPGASLKKPTWNYGGHIEGERIGDYVLKKSGLENFDFQISNHQILVSRHTVFWDPIPYAFAPPSPLHTIQPMGANYPLEIERTKTDHIYLSYYTEDGESILYSFHLETFQVEELLRINTSYVAGMEYLGLIEKKLYFLAISGEGMSYGPLMEQKVGQLHI